MKSDKAKLFHKIYKRYKSLRKRVSTRQLHFADQTNKNLARSCGMQAVDSVSAMMTFEIEALINLDVVPV